MKLNIKGLVFVGFAAAVFASAAQADPDPNAKIVTSKTYVDAKIEAQGEATGSIINENSPDDKAPSSLAVYNALTATENTIGNGQLSITLGTSNSPTTFNANQATNNPVSLTIPVKSTAAGEGLVPSADATQDAGKVLGSNGSWVAQPTVNDAKLTISIDGTNTEFTANEDTDTTITINTMTGAGQNTDGAKGLVPAPSAGDNTMFLRGDGSWATPTNTTYNLFDDTQNGLVEAPTTADQTAGNVLDANNNWVTNDTTTIATGGQNDADGTISVTHNGATTAVAVKNVEVTSHKITTIDASAASIENNGTGNTTYPTTKAVYDFMMNGWSASNCTDTNPCALVVGTNGVPSWQAIAQPGD